jgi:hypothetical protein
MQTMAMAKRTVMAALALGLAILPGCDELETVGPEGGVVVSRDGRVTLDIPAGALSEDVAVSIEAVDSGDVGGPEGAVGTAYEILPFGTTLQFPATLTYDLMASDDEGAQRLDLATSDMADAVLVTEKAHGWDRMADREVDAESGWVSASVLFFSAYAVVID